MQKANNKFNLLRLKLFTEISDKPPRLNTLGENMKKNKKVLVILLALISAPTSVMAKKAPSNCSTFGENPEITVCVEAQKPTDTLTRENYAQLKSTASALLAIQKKALKKPSKTTKAIMAPSTILPTGTSVLTSTPVIMPLPYVEVNIDEYETNEDPTTPTENNYNEIPVE